MKYSILNKINKHRLTVIWLAVTLVLIAISYSGITSQKILNWDDTDYLLKNGKIRSFSLDNIIWMFSDFSMANWHPLTWLSYTFNYSIWGNNATAYKAINVVLHSLNSILVYFLTYKILLLVRNNYHSNTTSVFAKFTDKDLLIGSLFCATLFAIHPLHVESVSWISERKDVLYSLFFLLTFLTYIKYKESNKKSNWFIISVVMFLCSLMSKPMAVTMPVLLILIDIYPLRTLKDKRSAKEIFSALFDRKITFILLAFLVSSIAILTQKSGIQDTEHLAIDSRIINACLSILLYIYNYAFPVNLSTYYSFHPWSTDPNIFSILPVATVGLVTLGFIYLAIRKKIFFPIIAWLYFIISLLPVIGIIKVGGQAAADRYTYLPLLSAFILTGAFAALLHNYVCNSKIKVIASSFIAATLIASFSYLTYEQNKHWTDDYSLWIRAINYSPGLSAIPYNNLGAMYFRQGESRSAIVQFNKALAIQPNDLLTMVRIGKAYELMREEAFAINAYNNVINAHPKHPTAYIRLGDLFYRKKLVDKAKMYYSKAFELYPTAPSTLQRSALVDFMNKDYDSAEEKLKYLQQISPNNRGGLQLLAKIMINTGRINEAKTIATTLLAKHRKDNFAKEILLLDTDSPVPDETDLPSNITE